MDYDLATKLFVACLLLLVVHDQLTAPSDPRDEPTVPTNPNAGLGPGRSYALEQKFSSSRLDDARRLSGVDMRAAALEEASLLRNLTQRAIPYAEAHVTRAAAALARAGAAPAPASGGEQALAPQQPRPAAYTAEAAAIARRSVGNPNEEAESSCQPTLHAGFNGGSLNWGMSFKVETAQQCCDGATVGPTLDKPITG